MERLKELAENLIIQVDRKAEKQELLEIVLEMVRELSSTPSRTTLSPIPEPIVVSPELVSTSMEDALSLNEVLKGVEEDLSARLTHSDIRSLREAIGINDRFVFVEKLFGNSISRFENVIDRMDKAGSYEASEQVLIDELTSHMPEDASPVVIDQLLALVRRRFPSK